MAGRITIRLGVVVTSVVQSFR